MATILQRQLAEIAAKSTHQLDLKAQKAQHARSLLFEPSDASHQSFDDIYQICIEGFEEICQLDSRFLPFANNLFDEGSKSVDRSQLTGKENEELDSILQRFLGLVQARLLLKPAQKSVEWLVRRWRVHEFNTEALLLAFLPYHTEPQLFPAVLSLLPANRQLPDSFKWLHPYIASRSCPPSHAVLAAAVSSRSFFTAFNTHTLAVAKAGHSSGVQLAFWTRLTLQAVNSMLELSQSGRADVRKQKQDDLLLKVLPTLRDAFHISKRHELDELYIGSCMVAVVLATKIELADSTLDAVMETVAATWTNQTLTAAVSCLGTLMEERAEPDISKSAVDPLFRADFVPVMVAMAQSQRMSKLAAASSRRLLHYGTKKGDERHFENVRQMLEANIIQQDDLKAVVQIAFELHEKQQNTTASRDIVELLTILANMEGGALLLEEAAHGAKGGSQVLQAIPGLQNHGTPEPMEIEDGESEEIAINHATPENDQAASMSDFTKLMDSLPQLPDEQYSFLDTATSNTTLFGAFSDVFAHAMGSRDALKLFVNQLSPHGTSVMSDHKLLSFLARIWATGSRHISATTKIQALRIANREIQNCLAQSGTAEKRIDLQLLFPYLLTALGDSYQNVRKSAADLLRSIDKLSRRGEVFGATEVIWGTESAKGESEEAWLSCTDSNRLLHDSLLPVLEDCVLDSNHIGLVTVQILNASTQKTMSREQRTSICDFLAWQAVATPVVLTRFCLLQILGQVRKVAVHARARYLFPFLQSWASLSEEDLKSVSHETGISLSDLDSALLENVWQYSDANHQAVREVCIHSQRTSFVEAVFERQQRSWTALKATEAKIDVVRWLLRLALGEVSTTDGVNDFTLQTLQSLNVPSEVLVVLLDDIPSLGDLQDQPSAHKKRRRSAEADQRPVSLEKIQVTTRKTIMILELLEASRSHSPELLRPLFHLLAELRQWKSLTGSDLTYLYSMLLDALLTIVGKAQQTGSTSDLVDKNIIRMDLLIECVRSSPSPQIHNTALLLISSLAPLMPEDVLHSVMPLFTSISTTILQRTDDYSAHITEHTVAHIVPALASSMKSRGQNVLIGVSEMLLSFVAAWEHIPLHRRLETFQMVVNAVGVQQCLGAVLAMLAERYLQNDATLSAFVVDMVKQRDAIQILEAAGQWLSLVDECLQAPQPKVRKQHAGRVSDVLFVMLEKDADERREAVEALLHGLQTVLRHSSTKTALVASLTKASSDDLQRIHLAYASLLERTVRLTQDFTGSDLGITGVPGHVLSAVLNLLPTTDFVASSAEIMQAGSDLSRQMVFQSLESRVQVCKTSNIAESQTFLNLLPACGAFIQPGQSMDVVAAAIGCVDAICEKFGKSNPKLVREAAEKVAGKAALASQDVRLRTLSLLCLASVAAVLEYGDESLSLFPKVLRWTLDSFTAAPLTSTGSASDEISDASFRLLMALLDHLPSLLTSNPADLDSALIVATKDRLHELDAASEFIDLAAKKTAAAELFLSIERVWMGQIREIETSLQMDRSDFQRFRQLTLLAHLAVQANTKAVMTKNASTIFRLLLEGLDLRRQVGVCDNVNEDVLIAQDDVFEAVGALALEVTLKMNDVTFRPFLIRLVEWATSSLSRTDTAGKEARLRGLYHFVFLLFERLGSLVTSYMSFLLESSAEIISQAATYAADSELLRAVTKVLDSSFRNDEDDFWTAPVHFEAIAGPLISRLGEAATPLSNQDDLVVEAISNLAVAVNASPEQLKFINTSLLALLKHINADVRLITLRCQRTITRKVNFDWLALLPEMLPVISELQEDDDERVEHETLVWVKEIEEISGESLEAMLA